MIKNLRDYLCLILLCLVSFPSFAIDFTYESNGLELSYTVLDENARTVETKAGVSSYPYTPGNNVSGDVTIPSTVYYNGKAYTVVSVGEYAFGNCKNLTSIQLPESLTSIGGSAFSSCTNLTSIHLPESLTSIGGRAFSGCSSLTSIQLPESLTSIGDYAFSNFIGLTSIQLPKSLTSIGKYAFRGCSRLKSIQLPESLTRIENYAFSGFTGLTSIKLPESITRIEANAFEDCTGLTSIQFPESLAYISGNAFQNCTGLTSIALPKKLISIGSSSFEGCKSLKNIYIPSCLNKINSIGYNAFKDTSLECIVLESSNYIYTFKEFGIKKVALLCDNPYIDDMFPETTHFMRIKNAGDVVFEDGYLYNSDKSTILFASLINGVCTLPPVEAIADNAFEYCSGITKLNIVKPLGYVGNNAFANCNNNLIINATISPAPAISESAFEGLYDTAILNVPEEIIGTYLNPHNNWNLFKNLSVSQQYPSAESFTSEGLSYRLINGRYAEVIADESYKDLTSVTIPEEVAAPDSPDTTFPVTGIAPGAFAGCESLTQVNIPETVKIIRDAAFLGCSSLANISIPESVTEIGSSAFVGTALSAINLPSVATIGDNAFDGVSTLRSVSIDKATSIGAYSFRGTAVTQIDLPSAVTVGRNAFDGVTSLSKLSIADDIQSIGAYAFRGTSITELNLASSKGLVLGRGAFTENKTLRTVTLGDGVVDAGDYSFKDCQRLSTLSLGKDLRKIGKSAFTALNGGVRNLTLPKDGALTEIADSAFFGFRISALDLPDALRVIGDEAFGSCQAVTRIVLPANPDLKIGRKAFINAQRLNEVEFPVTISSIGDSCFVDNVITTLHVKAETIGTDAFINSPKLASLEVSGSTIGSGAFQALPALVEATIDVKTIGTQAFQNSPLLETVTFTDNVETIGNEAFQRSSLLKKVHFGLGLKVLSSYSFAYCPIDSISFPSAPDPDPVIIIGSEAFSTGKPIVKYLSLGNRVKEINSAGIYMVKKPECIDLGNSIEKISTYSAEPNGIYISINDTLVLPASLKYFYITSLSADAILIPESDNTLEIHLTLLNAPKVYINRNIVSNNCIFTDQNKYIEFGDNAQANITLTKKMQEGSSKTYKLPKVVVGASVKNIKYLYANHVVLKEGPETIESLQIDDTSIRVPASVNSLKQILGGNLTDVIIADGTEPLNITGIGFNYSSSSYTNNRQKLKSVYIGRDIKSSTFTLEDTPNLESVIVGDSVTSINDRMFKNCTSLKSAVMGNAVTHIGDEAFMGCTGLDILSIGESTQTIGTNAYADCTGFSRIVARSLVPPTGNAGFGREVEDNVPLYVPDEAIDDYYDSDLFWLFQNIESQNGKIVEEVTTEGFLEVNVTTGEEIDLFEWLKFVFKYVGDNIGHHSPSKVRARVADAEEAPALRWFAPYPDIATVDQNGVVKVTGEGNVEIWAYVLDGSDKRIDIQVNKPVLIGDVNRDELLDLTDVNLLIDHIKLPDGGTVTLRVGDHNGDGVIDLTDVNMLIDNIKNK